MDHYLEIQLRPDPEFGAPMLMNALISKLHRALVEMEATDIGISFPDYSLSPRNLGGRLRLHGNEQRLNQLMEKRWLLGMSDHAICNTPQPVPAEAKHRIVQRRQVKSNAERLRRRRMKRKGETYEQAAQAIPISIEQKSNLPFATLSSRSTGELFKLFIDQGEPLTAEQPGAFSSYGLSKGATIPWF
ncbi:MAG: type I-F CRISPR-associated endoribonuclease Cas6/Csy4 [Saccharospirillum sp.]|nr:type I-F CRISPR-associated endoribonuclease Cas6/Csy4 [Saccharospirillum sp.]